MSIDKRYLVEIDPHDDSDQSEEIKSELEAFDFEVPSVEQKDDEKYIVEIRQIGNTDDSEDIAEYLHLALYDVESVELI